MALDWALLATVAAAAGALALLYKVRAVGMRERGKMGKEQRTKGRRRRRSRDRGRGLRRRRG